MAKRVKLFVLALVFAPAVTEYVVNARAARSGLSSQVDSDLPLGFVPDARQRESGVRYSAAAASVRFHFMPMAMFCPEGDRVTGKADVIQGSDVSASFSPR